MTTTATRSGFQRRLLRRRLELDLCLQDVAECAHLAPAQLVLMETSSVEPTVGELAALACALDITPSELLRPAADGIPPRRRFVDLSERQCSQLLEEGGTGQIVIGSADDPLVVLTDFVMVDGDIVFRGRADGILPCLAGRQAGLRVDRRDDGLTQGWTVKVTGRVKRVTSRQEIRRLDHLIRPWAHHDNDKIYLRLTPRHYSGRRFDGCGPVEQA